MPEIIMLKMGDTMTDGKLLRWRKSDGEYVDLGDVVAEIEMDKSHVEVEAEDAGILSLRIAEGQTVPVGTTIATITGSAPQVYNVLVPYMGEDVMDGTLVRWLKQNGEWVEAGSALVEMETDKVNVEIPAEDSGVLSICIAEGQTVPVGTTIATITGSDTSVWPPRPLTDMEARQRGLKMGTPSSTPLSNPASQSDGAKTPWLKGNVWSVVLWAMITLISFDRFAETRQPWHLAPGILMTAALLWRIWISRRER